MSEKKAEVERRKRRRDELGGMLVSMEAALVEKRASLLTELHKATGEARKKLEGMTERLEGLKQGLTQGLGTPMKEWSDARSLATEKDMLELMVGQLEGSAMATAAEVGEHASREETEAAVEHLKSLLGGAEAGSGAAAAVAAAEEFLKALCGWMAAQADALAAL